MVAITLHSHSGRFVAWNTPKPRIGIFTPLFSFTVCIALILLFSKTAQEYIQSKVIDEAKERIFDHDKSISQVAYDLGFKYPQHFARLFKQRVGQSPNEYRSLN